MKNLYSKLFVICCSIIAFACSKNSVSRNNSIVGTWELRHTWGGLSWVDSLYAENNGNMYVFSKDSVEQYSKNKLVNKDKYFIKKADNRFTDSTIYFGADTLYGRTIKISNDTLYFDLEAPAGDGYASAYVKIAQ